MPRLGETGRRETDTPLIQGAFDVVFGPGADPMRSQALDGTTGNWWRVFALVPDVLDHAVRGFLLYRSPQRRLDPLLRELAMARVGMVAGSRFVASQHRKALAELGVEPTRLEAVASWRSSDAFSEIERAVLAYTDAIGNDHGDVDDATFDVLHRHLDDAAVLELTYITAMYLQHAVIARALHLESDAPGGDLPTPPASGSGAPDTAGGGWEDQTTTGP
jgi:alkylhydroperoxidase family enzyme